MLGCNALHRGAPLKIIYSFMRLLSVPPASYIELLKGFNSVINNRAGAVVHPAYFICALILCALLLEALEIGTLFYKARFIEEFFLAFHSVSAFFPCSLVGFTIVNTVPLVFLFAMFIPLRIFPAQ